MVWEGPSTRPGLWNLGLSFLDATDEDRDAIDRFLRYQLPELF